MEEEKTLEKPEKIGEKNKKVKDSIKRSPQTQVDLDELMNQLEPNKSSDRDSQKSENSEKPYTNIKTKRPAPAIPIGVQQIPRAGELPNDNRPFRQPPVRPIQPEVTNLVRPKPTVKMQNIQLDIKFFNFSQLFHEILTTFSDFLLFSLIFHVFYFFLHFFSFFSHFFTFFHTFQTFFIFLTGIPHFHCYH